MSDPTTWDRFIKKMEVNELDLNDLKECMQEAIQSFLTPDEHSSVSLTEAVRQKSGGSFGPSRSGGLQTIDSKERDEAMIKILEYILSAKAKEDLTLERLTELIEEELKELSHVEKEKLQKTIDLRLGDELESLREGEESLEAQEQEFDKRVRGENVVPLTRKK